MVVWGGLTISYEKKRSRGKAEKERDTNLNESSKEQQGGIRKPSSVISAKKKKIEENNRMGKTRNLIQKIRDTREHFRQRLAQLRTETVWT